MRLRRSFPCALLVLASAAGASPFQATLSISVLGAEFHFRGSGNGYNTPALVTLPGGIFTGTASATLFTTHPLSAVVVTLAPGGAGVFSGAPLAGAMPQRGNLLAKNNGGTVAVVPLNSGYDLEAFGVGGTVQVDVSDQSLIVYFGPWSAGMPTLPGGGSAMYTGGDARTPGGRGAITLVSPAKISDPGSLEIVVLGTLRVDFVPEPAAPLLLATGAALLCGLGRRRLGGRIREG
jgi:hypothetical protein